MSVGTLPLPPAAALECSGFWLGDVTSSGGGGGSGDGIMVPGAAYVSARAVFVDAETQAAQPPPLAFSAAAPLAALATPLAAVPATTSPGGGSSLVDADGRAIFCAGARLLSTALHLAAEAGSSAVSDGAQVSQQPPPQLSGASARHLARIVGIDAAQRAIDDGLWWGGLCWRMAVPCRLEGVAASAPLVIPAGTFLRSATDPATDADVAIAHGVVPVELHCAIDVWAGADADVGTDGAGGAPLANPPAIGWCPVASFNLCTASGASRGAPLLSDVTWAAAASGPERTLLAGCAWRLRFLDPFLSATAPECEHLPPALSHAPYAALGAALLGALTLHWGWAALPGSGTVRPFAAGASTLLALPRVVINLGLASRPTGGAAPAAAARRSRDVCAVEAVNLTVHVSAVHEQRAPAALAATVAYAATAACAAAPWFGGGAAGRDGAQSHAAITRILAAGLTVSATAAAWLARLPVLSLTDARVLLAHGAWSGGGSGQGLRSADEVLVSARDLRLRVTPEVIALGAACTRLLRRADAAAGAPLPPVAAAPVALVNLCGGALVLRQAGTLEEVAPPLLRGTGSAGEALLPYTWWSGSQRLALQASLTLVARHWTQPVAIGGLAATAAAAERLVVTQAIGELADASGRVHLACVPLFWYIIREPATFGGASARLGSHLPPALRLACAEAAGAGARVFVALLASHHVVNASAAASLQAELAPDAVCFYSGRPATHMALFARAF